MPEVSVSRRHPALELLELGKTFKQAAKEPVTAWPVRLWDMGVDGISQAAVEAGKLSAVICHPSLRSRLHKPRQYEGISP